MKNFLFLLLSLVIMTSCVEGGYSASGIIMANFEYSQDYSDSFGADSLYFDAENGLGLAWQGHMAFNHKVENKEFKGGFMLSYLKPMGVDEKPKDHVKSPYRVVGQHQPNLRNTYAVFCQSENSMMPERDIEFIGKNATYMPTACWVNNTETVYDAIKESFRPGDELKLIAQGYVKGAPTLSTEIKLAADTTVYNWTKFDLSPLGQVEAIDFTLASTNESIPLAFCMDEFITAVEINY